MRFLRLLWNRITHEVRLWWRGWDYTEKPMLGKPLWYLETKYIPTEHQHAHMILFKRENQLLSDEMDKAFQKKP